MAFTDQAIAELGEVVEVLRRWPRRVAVEPRQPMPHVGGIADLAHLAVAHDVEPGVLLHSHRVADTSLQRLVDEASVARLSTLQREQHVEDVSRPRETADVSCEHAHESTIDDRRFTDWRRASVRQSAIVNRQSHYPITRRTRRSDERRAGSCTSWARSTRARSARTSG